MRKSIPRKTQHDILTKSRRRCAICYFYLNDVEPKEGQIAHIDRNNQNNEESNLVFLCLNHHDKYDSKTSQSKGYITEEVATAKAELERNIKVNFREFVSKTPTKEKLSDNNITRVTLEAYDRRYPIYEAWFKFVVAILTEINVDEKERAFFVKATSDALFLFGEEIDQYLSEIHSKAMRLRTAQRTMQRDNIENEKWQKALDEEERVSLWFEKQLTDGKYLFSKYMTIKC